MNRNEIKELITKYDFLFEKYGKMGNELIREFEENKDKYRIEYSKGGETLNRGFYSPSLADIYIGGCNRGRLLKRVPKVPNYNYEYYFDSHDRLVCCKKFTNEWKINDLDCTNIEFLLYEEGKVLGLNYGCYTSIDLQIISECQYDNDTLIRYEQVAFLFGSYNKKVKEITIQIRSYKGNEMAEFSCTDYSTYDKRLLEERYAIQYREGKRPYVNQIESRYTELPIM